jgi:hypothetical protein
MSNVSTCVPRQISQLSRTITHAQDLPLEMSHLMDEKPEFNSWVKTAVG